MEEMFWTDHNCHSADDLLIVCFSRMFCSETIRVFDQAFIIKKRKRKSSQELKQFPFSKCNIKADLDQEVAACYGTLLTELWQ